MIKCRFITLGSLKEKYLKEACEEYKKRLSRYCDLEICEIEPVRLPDKPSQSEINFALKREGELINKKIPAGAEVVALCVEGSGLSSENFAKKIKNNVNMGKNICFIIGSSYGLSQEIKQISNVKLSLSEMTFPHQLFRVMLLEQLYRAFKINEGSAYHK